MKLISLENAYEEISKVAGNRILGYTIPLFEYLSNGHAEKIASAVCLDIEDRMYAATASHVFEGRDPNNIGTLSKNDFISFTGSLKRTQLPENEAEDRIDLAVCRLSPEATKRITDIGYSFYKVSKDDLSSSYKRSGGFLILGWPNNGEYLKVLPDDKKIRARAFRYGTKLDKEIHSEDDIVLEYHRKKSRAEGSGNVCIAPYPKGLSGCGVWHINSFVLESPQNVSFRFCGVVRQYRKETHKIYANKTGYIFEIAKSI